MQMVRTPTPQDETAVLQFEAARLPLSDGTKETVALDFNLYPGELALLQVEDAIHEEAVTQASCGLLQPLNGRVCFLGRDWNELSPDWANASRGRIGVIFRSESWVPYLSMMENVILAQLHHTRRPLEEICQEAALWAGRFGLPGLPRDLPAAISPEDRAVANLVRAFVGAPSLIVVEHLAVQPSGVFLQKLVNAMRDVREHGAAILWLTQDLALARNDSIPATQRVVLDGSWRGAGEAVA